MIKIIWQQLQVCRRDEQTTRRDEQTDACTDGRIMIAIRSRKHRIRSTDRGRTDNQHYQDWRGRTNNLPVLDSRR
jgi:hypothetical protein